MGNMYLKNKNKYFNSVGVLCIFLSGLSFILIDSFSLSQNIKEEISMAFYFKFIICILFFMASKREHSQIDNLISIESHDANLNAPFHFSAIYITLWLGIKSLVSPSIEISWYVGVFLFFGGLAAFIFVQEFTEELKQKMTISIFLYSVLNLSSKIFVFSIFIMATYFITQGDSSWILIPFYDWNL